MPFKDIFKTIIIWLIGIIIVFRVATYFQQFKKRAGGAKMEEVKEEVKEEEKEKPEFEKKLEEMKLENTRMETNIKELKELKAIKALGGQTEESLDTTPKEETPQEYAKRIKGGQL